MKFPRLSQHALYFFSLRRVLVLGAFFHLFALSILRADYVPPPAPLTSDSEEIDAEDLPEPEEPQPIERDVEEPSILPPDLDVHTSTRPITPITRLPKKDAFDAAKEALTRAENLRKKGYNEAASDLALVAYDDLRSLSRPRKKKARAARRKIVYRAAEVYVRSSISYIEDYVERNKRTPEIVYEGRSRLDDLKDVAHSYPDLYRLVQRAKDKL